MDQITTIDQLREHLQLNLDSDFCKEFELLADALLNGFVVVKGNKRYRILEIEFYHSQIESPLTVEKVTYPRVAAAGRWFFHSSGVDICFASGPGCYGGILIRSIREMSSDRPVCGPYNVMDELFDQFDALENPEDFPLLKAVDQYSRNEVLSGCRYHTTKKAGKVWPEDVDPELTYRYYLSEEVWRYDRSQRYNAYPFRNR